MSGAVTAVAVGSAVGLGAGALGVGALAAGALGVGAGLATMQGQQARAQTKAQQSAQQKAQRQVQQQAAQAQQAMNRANQKQPDAQRALSAIGGAARAGQSGTMLTGPQGVDQAALTLGKSTLLGQ
ncbi:Uncharacterised protein [Mycobacteroides abscessus subsp. abscessus]|uniref:Bbp22 n=1 Tax=Bordetella bronchiseptica 253 TaxID=568707 RepID=A0A0C6NZB7_BORBO|nr:bbp22 [Bordetella bronchiseptica 253]SHT00380.1 Uncharacterised protein [Mycobacteroides abscessus subsp. abscessus]